MGDDDLEDDENLHRLLQNGGCLTVFTRDQHTHGMCVLQCNNVTIAEQRIALC